MTSPLGAHRAALDTCVFCPKLCRFACPVAEAEARETVTPWGLMTLIDDVVRGTRPLDAEAAAVWAHCTGCGRCTAVCHHANPVYEVLTAARAAAAAQGVAPPEALAWATAAPAQSAHLDALPSGGAVQLYAGAADDAAIGEALALLRAAGYVGLSRPTAPLPAGWARGAEVGEPVPWSTAAFAGAEQIICLHAADVLALRAHPRDPGAGARAVHLIEALDGRLPSPRRLAVAGDVAYLDPCRLARGLSVTEAPRRLLAAVVGGQVHEAVMAGAEGGCCGAGGGYAAVDPEAAAWVAREAMQDLPAVPVVSAEPACAAQLATGISGATGPVWRLTTLLASALAGEGP